jgi:uncharacterized protein (DUF1330 family)
MAAYVIADLVVHDQAGYQRYQPIARETIEKHGGRFIVRGGQLETMEGDWSPKRIVVVEFPSLEAARAWYHSPEYAEGIRLRKACAMGSLIIVDGASPA